MAEDVSNEEQPDSSAENSGEGEAEDESSPEQTEGAEDTAVDEGGEQSGDEKKPEGPCYRILVVEDSTITRKILVRILQDAGHTCEEGTQGHDGLAYLRRSKSMQTPYDLVITDLLMPEMDGWEFIDNMIEKGFFPQTPVVIITAEATRESVQRSGKLGIRNFIVKPFDPARVLMVVNRAVEEGTAKKSE